MAEDSPPGVSLGSIEERLGSPRLDARLGRQADLWAKKTHQGEGVFVLERYLPMDDLIRMALRVSGLCGHAYRQFLDIQIVQREVTLPLLPESFDGFRLLQLADLHCDLDPRFLDVLIERLKGLEYDLAVLTGDYHNKIGTCYRNSMEAMERLVPHLAPEPLGILGNHDFLEKVVVLEEAGLRILLNENVPIQRGADTIWICGIDDPHFYHTHCLPKARHGVPENACAILLSHSPETYAEASALGFDLLLSGHTHGGQICLPGRVPVLRNARVPPQLLVGDWTWGRMQGYTSPGTGSCGVAARLFCPPEITVHVLRAP